MRSVTTHIETYLRAHAGHVSLAVFLLGFVLDYLTLPSINSIYTYMLLSVYLGAVALLLFFRTLPVVRKHRHGERMRLFALIPLQFLYGALMSALLVFTLRGAPFTLYALFVGLLLVIILLNEYYRKQFGELTIQVWGLYTILLLLGIFIIPTFTGFIGIAAFIAGSVSALVCIAVLLGVYLLLHRTEIVPVLLRLVIGIAVITVLVVLLFVGKLLPPLPLMLRDIAVVHQFNKIGDTYTGYVESKTLRERLPWSTQTLSRRAGEALSVYTSVIAPRVLRTTLVHHWEYYDVDRSSWISMTRVAFPIRGGRETGYRGYSTKEQLFAGLWRVSVETDHGDLLGRTKFYVVDSQSTMGREYRVW